MNHPADDIELCASKNIEAPNILEGESSQERGVHGSTSAKSKCISILSSEVLQVVIYPNDVHHHDWKRFIPSWDVIFIVASAFAVFIDPLICYSPLINEDRLCFYWDLTLIRSFFALRSVFDLFYAMDIVVYLLRSCHNGEAKSFGAAWIDFFGGPRTKISKFFLNHKKLLVLLGILPRICAALPVLEALILLGVYVFDHVHNSKLFYLIVFQYSLRAYNLYRWLDQHARILNTAIRRFCKALLDFLPFILTAHLFGALWYYYAVNQEIICWQEYLCYAKRACSETFYCAVDYTENVKSIQQACAIQVSNDVPALPFDFGIYLYALQSNLTRTRDLPMKILQCFWWGLRNLSSFGSNLQTSFHEGEIILSIAMSISGLALFLVYLNARVQVSQQISGQFKLRKKTETVRYLQMVGEVRNMYRLRLDLLNKVSTLKGVDGKVLHAICDRLKPVTYDDDFYIIREGELVRKMIFITKGSALMYTNSNGGTNLCEFLERNDYYGEELVNWAFKFASFSELPVSTRTVLCQTKVEALAIPANHLKSIVAKFWWHFKKGLTPPHLEQLAASSLQAAWRRCRARKKAKLAAN